MPTFSFSFSKKKEKQASKNNNRNKVILKNIRGVVWINVNAEYTVVILKDKTEYPIHHSCYSCKGQFRIYRQGVNDKSRFCYIRLQDKCTEQNTNYWLPFAPGCVVCGNLVQDNITYKKVFVIKECWTELNNEEANKAFNYYKKHMKEINDLIKTHALNDF